MVPNCLHVLVLLLLFCSCTTGSVQIERLPLPPTAPSTAVGSCNATVNPHGTGCLTPGRDGIFGMRTFTWDGQHVLVGVSLAGAPAAPSPASAFSGPQLILVKTNGQVFSNGDPWKCLTCGIPAGHKAGSHPGDFGYPEAFRDERRVKAGSNVLDCSPYRLVDDACTAAVMRVYGIQSPFPPSSYGIMRELRLHPDEVHVAWNQLFLAGTIEEFGVFGRLSFAQHLDPPAYVVSNVSFLVSRDPRLSGNAVTLVAPPAGAKPGILAFSPPNGVVGELRGFNSAGSATLGIGMQDSFNFDIFQTDLQTGKSVRLSVDPAYTDPVHMSPDSSLLLLLDGRVDDRTGQPDGYPAGESGRMYFASAAPGVPPLIDFAIGSAIANLYNQQYGQGTQPDDHTNGRRFFLPYLIDLTSPRRPGNKDIHDGQRLNDGGDPRPGSGSISDPLWNAGADVAWSPDGTQVAYYEVLVAAPACGETEPACPTSREPGGRFTRLMLARLDGRKPHSVLPKPDPVSDRVPWATAWVPGDPQPVRPSIPSGNYSLPGLAGHADVVLELSELTHARVYVQYHNFSTDMYNFVDGIEEGVRATNATGATTFTWHANLTLSGLHQGTRRTSEPSGFIVISPPGLAQPPTILGTLTTTLDGKVFLSPTR